MNMARKNISTLIDEDLYLDLQILALQLTKKKKKRVHINDLLEEGIRMVLDSYRSELDEE